MWTLLAVLIAAPVALPLVVVVGGIVLFPTSEVWSHLAATVLLTYALNTVSLMMMVGLLATSMGIGAAWLTAHYRFIGSDWLGVGTYIAVGGASLRGGLCLRGLAGCHRSSANLTA